jgi:hypothetical protein
VTISDKKSKAILDSKKWLVLNEGITVSVGDVLFFNIDVHETFSDEQVNALGM